MCYELKYVMATKSTMLQGQISVQCQNMSTKSQHCQISLHIVKCCRRRELSSWCIVDTVPTRFQTGSMHLVSEKYWWRLIPLLDSVIDLSFWYVRPVVCRLPFDISDVCQLHPSALNSMLVFMEPVQKASHCRMWHSDGDVQRVLSPLGIRVHQTPQIFWKFVQSFCLWFNFIRLIKHCILVNFYKVLTSSMWFINRMKFPIKQYHRKIQ